MVVEFPYGDDCITLEEQQEVKSEIVYPTRVASIDTNEGFQQALSRQDHAKHLSHIIRKAESATISIETKYLRSMLEPMLSELLNQLVGAGIPPEAINVVFNERDIERSGIDITSISTEQALVDCNIVRHNPSDTSDLVWVGETVTSNSIMLRDICTRTDFRVGLGAIVPDALIGASGGGTAILPNITGEETIFCNHRMRMHTKPRFFDITQPAARDIAEAARLGNLDYVFNCVMNGFGRPVSIVAGFFPDAWNQGVQTAERITVKNTPDCASIVVVGGGGEPFDATIYDVLDCLLAAERITMHGGTIILVAECKQGFGPSGFEKGMTDNAVSLNNTEFQVGMEKAHLLRRIIETRNLIIVTDIHRMAVEGVLKARKANTLHDAIDMALANHPSYPRTVIIPDGRFIYFR
ncbi:MAG: lactate racemase domain-containing protein [Candidatus Thorarchaeota archaeon]